jgi:aconitate hydratase
LDRIRSAPQHAKGWRQGLAYYSLNKAAAQFGDISRLPFSMKVLLENLLRFEDGGFTVSTRT